MHVSSELLEWFRHAWKADGQLIKKRASQQK